MDVHDYALLRAIREYDKAMLVPPSSDVSCDTVRKEQISEKTENLISRLEVDSLYSGLDGCRDGLEAVLPIAYHFCVRFCDRNENSEINAEALVALVQSCEDLWRKAKGLE